MVDRYHKSGYALPVPCGSERGYVCEKEEKRSELKDDMPVRRRENNFIKYEKRGRRDVMCVPALFVCSGRGKYRNGFWGRRNLKASLNNFKGGGCMI